MTYLGAIISDSGNLKCDVKLYTEGKRSNLTIKYNNVTYIRYYDHPIDQSDNPKRSQELLELEFRNHLVEKFKNSLLQLM